MDGLRELLETIKRQGYARRNFLGLLNVLIGRRIQTAEGVLLSTGTTWRTLAELLKRVRWDKNAVRELGLDPAALPPRDRLRFWYLAIAAARVDSAAATEAGDRLAEQLRTTGYQVAAAPRPWQGTSPAAETGDAFGSEGEG